MVVPRIVPWANPRDLEDLKRWFYPGQMTADKTVNDIDCRLRAIQRVKCYQSRGSQYLPHVIDSTAQLTSSILLDEKNCSLGGDSYTTRLSYTMALIRFVNGLLDPSQQSQYAIPLHTLAKKIGLPSLFVDLRHEGTHERELPSLEMLRHVSSQALNWLWDNYWNDDELDNYDEENESEFEDEVVLELRKHFEQGSRLKNILLENRPVWENTNTALIRSTNFVVAEKNIHRKERSPSPDKKIIDFITRTKTLWKQCSDKVAFIEEFILKFEPVFLEIFFSRVKGFDLEFCSWLAKCSKDAFSGTQGALKKKFPTWRSLEKNLLNEMIKNIDLNNLISQWALWNQILDEHLSVFTLWMCEALAERMEKHKRSQANKRRKKNRQTELSLDFEFKLQEKIDKLSKLFSDTDKRMYDLKASHPISSENASRGSDTEKSNDRASKNTNDILNDLANLKKRMYRSKTTNEEISKPEDIKIWSWSAASWEPRPFGTF